LGYFGDTGTISCGHCDNCASRGGPARSVGLASIDSPAGREVGLKLLSGVARAKGKFGKTTVAQMLTGAGSEKMDRWGLRRLKTFGILGEFKQSEVTQLLDALTDAGLLKSEDVDRFRPILNVSETGWAVMRGKDASPIALAIPQDLAAKVRLGGLQRLGSRPEPEVEPESVE